MVGGGEGSFIGGIHRAAARLDGRIDLVAGALASTEERARASGVRLGLPDQRNYGSWEQMLERECALPPEERIDFVSIVTPNDSHYPIAKAFVAAGFNVVLDKPMVHTSEQARSLVAAVEQSGVLFAVTYNYTGYPMVRQARDLVRAGELGEVRKVVVEYFQGWLANPLERQGVKQAEWRTDPRRAGIGGALGDIGSHAENLMSTVTDLEIEALAAELSTLLPGRRLDDDATILLRFRGGARGILSVSQVATGEENSLSLRVYGTRGSLCWRHQNPETLVVVPAAGPLRLERRGHPYLDAAARAASRLPPGHPEGFIEGFANIYTAFADAVIGAGTGHTPSDTFPTVREGARGVSFIEQAVASAQAGSRWVRM